MSGEGDRKPYGNGNGKVSLRELKKYLDGNMTYYARRYYGRTQQAQIVVNGKELSPTNQLQFFPTFCHHYGMKLLAIIILMS